MTNTITELTFHNSKYTYERSLIAGKTKGWITPDDERLILEFVSWKSLEGNISPGRQKKIVSTLVNWKNFLPIEYSSLTMNHLMTGIHKMKTGNSQKGKTFEINTQHDFIRILKMFLYWMIENEYSTLPINKVKKIQAPKQNYDTTEPHEILTKEEIELLLNSCPTSRDRCLIGILYETGARVSEVAQLDWKNIAFDNYGVKVYISDEKTQKKRYSRVTMMTQFIAQWRADYWGPKDAMGLPELNAPMFISREGNTLTYIAVYRLLERVKEAAGITRKITPHLFRKSRITHMVAQNYQESVIKQSMWNNLSTGMFKTYVKLSEKDIDSEFLTRAGLKTKEENDRGALKPSPCMNCHTVNPPTANFCLKCGTPLNEKTKQSVESTSIDVRQVLAENPKAQAAFFEILKELNKSG
jgi:integrase/recombinase XerD